MNVWSVSSVLLARFSRSKKAGALLTLLFALLLGALISAPPALARYAAIVIDAKSGQVLYEANADSRKYPASLTKMMTLYMAFEAIDRGKLKLSSPLKVSKRAQGMAPSKLGLKRGETITLKQAIFALITKSANDAAVVIAEAIGGTEIDFAKMMTAKAKKLGMLRTTFRNASGLPNRHQKSTARDMSRLAVALRRNFPHHYHYFKTRKFTFRKRSYSNHNNLLKSYPGTDGLKTGYIRASGFNLVASVERKGRRLIGVVFGGKSARSRDKHMIKLFNRGFATLPAMVEAPPIPGRNPLYADTRLARSAPSEAASSDVASQVATTALPKRKPLAGDPEPLITEAAPPNHSLAATAETANTIDNLVAAVAVEPTGGRPAIATTPPAAMSPAATSPAVALPAATRQQAWAVQVGAFSSYTPAQIAATQAARRVPELLMEARLLVSQINGDSGPLYRAQLTGLQETQARGACRQLKALKQDCVVVVPDPTGHALTMSATE